MHPQAYDFVAAHARPWPGLRVLDIGGQDMNGSVRPLYQGAEGSIEYLSLDIAAGPGVDIVADATTWLRPPGCDPFDVVVCCEVFEHCEGWRDIVTTAYEALRPGGLFIATMAGPGRPPHPGRTSNTEGPEPGEWYQNIDPVDLAHVVEGAGFVDVTVDVAGGVTHPGRRTEDVRVVARRPMGVHLLTAIYGGYDTRILGQAWQERAPGQSPQGWSFVMVADEAPMWASGTTDDQRSRSKMWPEVVIEPPASTMADSDPRQAARFPKFLPHEHPADWFADGDVVVWIDGRIELLSPRFVAMVVEALGDADYAAWEHPTCRTMAQQAVECLRDMPAKYDRQDLIGHYAMDQREATDLWERGYDRVWRLTVLATRINERTRAVGGDVLAAMHGYPRSIDQAEFPFAVRRHGATVAPLPGGPGGFWALAADGWFTVWPHSDGT